MKDLKERAYPRRWLELTLWEVDEHRADNCPFEGDCIAFAAHKKWEGFTCKECELFLENRERK